MVGFGVYGRIKDAERWILAGNNYMKQSYDCIMLVHEWVLSVNDYNIRNDYWFDDWDLGMRGKVWRS